MVRGGFTDMNAWRLERVSVGGAGAVRYSPDTRAWLVSADLLTDQEQDKDRDQVGTGRATRDRPAAAVPVSVWGCSDAWACKGCGRVFSIASKQYALTHATTGCPDFRVRVRRGWDETSARATGVRVDASAGAAGCSGGPSRRGAHDARDSCVAASCPGARACESQAQHPVRGLEDRYRGDAADHSGEDLAGGSGSDEPFSDDGGAIQQRSASENDSDTTRSSGSSRGVRSVSTDAHGLGGEGDADGEGSVDGSSSSDGGSGSGDDPGAALAPVVDPGNGGERIWRSHTELEAGALPKAICCSCWASVTEG